MTSADFQCRYGCGTWCHVLPSVKTKSGKLVPLDASTNMPHACHLSPYFRPGKTGMVKARAATMEALSKIDEYARKEGVEV